MTKEVATPSQDYEAMFPFWALTRSLRGGTHEMRAAGEIYLPQEPDESQAAYEARLNRSVLTNLYRKTVDKLVGKPLKKPIVIGEDVPDEIKDLLDDVDALGTRIDVFAKNVMTQAIDDGLTHILVDFSDTEGDIENDDGTRSVSVAQAREQNVRPFARHVKASELIGWKYAVENGSKVLTQIRIFEGTRADDPEDEFAQEIRERIRVIERDSWRLFERQQDDWVQIDDGENSLGFIPLVTLYTNRVGFMLARPWLEDIAHLNVAHWQSDSDQRNLLHIARVPVLFAKGFGSDDDAFSISIGANSFVRAPASADLKYVEHSGKGLESGRNDLKDIEERIQMLGLETLIKRPSGQSVTATQKAIDTADANSSLAMISQELENALELMLDYFAAWLDLDDGGDLTVFKDFSIELADAKDVDALLKARQTEEISRLTLLTELKRRGLLAEDFDPEQEIDLLDLNGGIDS